MATMNTGLGGPAGYGENAFSSATLAAGTTDDGSVAIDTTAVFGPSGINFYGTNYTTIYLNSNGTISFASPLTTTSTGDLTTESTPLLAPFWGDVNIDNGGEIYWDIDPTAGTITMTWDSVMPFTGSGTNSFQVVLTDTGGGNFGVEYIYEDIQWSSGDSGSDQADVGWTDGGTNDVVLNGSANSRELLNYNTTDFGAGDPVGTYQTSFVSGVPVTSDGTVTGTSGADVIDANYAGDPDGDTVDNGQSTGAGGDENTIDAGAGNDTIIAGAENDSILGGDGNDTVFGDLGTGPAGTSTAESLNWTAQGAGGTDIASGFVQDTGDMNVTVSFVNDGSNTAIQTNGSNIYTGSGPYASDSSLYLTGDAGPNVTATFDFTAEAGSGLTDTVENIEFMLNDVDISSWSDIVTVNAYDENGNPVAVTLTALGNDSVSGQTVTGAGGTNDTQNVVNGAVQVTIAGPVATFEIIYENGGTAGQALWVSDIHYDTVPYIEGDDTLDGGTGDDLMYGEGGADIIYGGSGFDTGYGGTGNDSLFGFGDDDTLFGGDGNDYVDGDAGADSLSGDAGADTIVGDGGNDSISGGSGADSIYAGADDDTVTGGADNDLVYLGAGNDSFGDYSTEAGNDTVYGGDGNDFLNGGGDDDQLYGDAGDDTLTGATGNDTLYGGLGSDQFWITDDHDQNSIFGGEDVGYTDWDAVWFSNYISLQGVTVTGTGDESGTYDFVGTTGTGSFAQIEAIGGTAYDDTLNLSADSSGMYLYGGDGSDTITGGAGGDNIEGGTGNDVIYGGGGNDYLSGGTGADTATGGQGDDHIVISEGDSASGGDGDDLFTLADYAEATTGTINIDGGGTGESGLGDTLQLGSLADLSTLNITSTGVNASGNTTQSGTVTLDDGTVLTFNEIENIICFTPGTRIATPRGAVLVQDLRVGDQVVTRDHGLQTIRWIESSTVPARGKLAPIHIRPSAHFGSERDLIVSPQHRLLFHGYRAELLFGDSEVLVAAQHLVDGHDVTQNEGDAVTYIHFLLDQHEVVYAEGVPTESFHPGRLGIDTVGEAAREELFAIFPKLRSDLGQYGQTARRCLKKHEAQLIRS